jgi:hypothetical protein
MKLNINVSVSPALSMFTACMDLFSDISEFIVSLQGLQYVSLEHTEKEA